MKSHHSSSIIMVKQKTLEYKARVVYTNKKKKIEYFVRNNNDDHHGRLNIIFFFIVMNLIIFSLTLIMTQIKPCFECNIDNEFDDLTSSKFILLRITPE